MTHFLIGGGFGLVGIACIFMVIVWAMVAMDRGQHPKATRIRGIAWLLGLSSFALSGLSFNRAMEELLGYGFPPVMLYIGLGLMVVAKVGLMSSSSIDGSRSLALWFAGVSVLWVAICAWSVFA